MARASLHYDTTRRTLGAHIEAIEEVSRPRAELTLIVAACKGPRLDWLIEKCTELGVSRIVLAEFERSVVRCGPRHVEKLRRTAIEASKQCRRAWLPEIAAGLSLAEAVAPCDGIPLLIAHPEPSAAALPDWLARHASERKLSAVVGPEGGLTPTEIVFLRSAGAVEVRLAETVLRVETAAAAIAACWGACQIKRP